MYATLHIISVISLTLSFYFSLPILTLAMNTPPQEISKSSEFFEEAKLLINNNTPSSLIIAETLLLKAVSLEPKNVKYRLSLGSVIETYSTYNAITEYKRILEIDSTNATAWYRIGKLKAAEFQEYNNAFSAYFSLTHFAMEDFYEAEKHLTKAILYNSTNTDTYLQLALLYEDAGMYSQGIALLKKLLTVNSDHKDAYLYLGLLYYRTSQMATSQDAYQSALSLMDDSEKSDFLYLSVRTMLESGELGKSGDLDSTAWKILIDAYWQKNDPLYLTTYNERFLEHLSRVTYANLRYSVPKKNIKGWQSDRGEIVVRYGEPLSKKRSRPSLNNGIEYGKTEEWYYENMTFGFVDEFNTNHFTFTPEKCSESRFQAQYDENSHELAAVMRKSTPEMYTPKFAGPTLQVPISIVQLKTLEENLQQRTDVYVNYGFDVEAPFSIAHFYTYHHDWGMFLFDNFTNKIAEKRDSFTEIYPERFIDVHDNHYYMINSEMLPIAQDSGNFAFEIIRNFDNGTFSDHRQLIIKKFSSEYLQISDIILAFHIEDHNLTTKSSLVRRNIGILPNPTHIFSKDHYLYIYFEIYNISLNNNDIGRFQQHIELRCTDEWSQRKSLLKKVFGSVAKILKLRDSQDRVVISSEVETRDSFMQMYLQLDMSSYAPGNYRLRVTILDTYNNSSVFTETDFTFF